jgi:hypothetical protein
MFKIGGGVIWVALFAMVMTSVIRSENINATPHSVGQLHHTGKAQQSKGLNIIRSNVERYRRES